MCQIIHKIFEEYANKKKPEQAHKPKWAVEWHKRQAKYEIEKTKKEAGKSK